MPSIEHSTNTKNSCAANHIADYGSAEPQNGKSPESKLAKATQIEGLEVVSDPEAGNANHLL